MTTTGKGGKRGWPKGRKRPRKLVSPARGPGAGLGWLERPGRRRPSFARRVKSWSSQRKKMGKSDRKSRGPSKIVPGYWKFTPGRIKFDKRYGGNY